MVLKKDDLVDRLREYGYTKKDSRRIIDDLFEVIIRELVDGNDVKIRGFGLFTVVTRAAREMISVIDGERISTPEFKIPKFVPGGTLRASIREGIYRE